jgi:hypothetical protein
MLGALADGRGLKTARRFRFLSIQRRLDLRHGKPA